ncbi:hypothetical protein V6N13_130249 [Hibiscus sabdariffa]
MASTSMAGKNGGCQRNGNGGLKFRANGSVVWNDGGSTEGKGRGCRWCSGSGVSGMVEDGSVLGPLNPAKGSGSVEQAGTWACFTGLGHKDDFNNIGPFGPLPRL